MKKSFWMLAACSVSGLAMAGVMDRPDGIKIGERMVLRPSLNIGFTYDSNSYANKDNQNNYYFFVTPSLAFEYAAEKWSLSGEAHYTYNAYMGSNSSQLSNSAFGENLNWSYAANDDGMGWSFMLGESYQRSLQDDNLQSDGRGVGRNRDTATVTAALNNRLNEYWHAGLNGSFYWIDYANDVSEYRPMYGWSRWSAGANAGFTASQWTDFFLSGSYSGYFQKNNNSLTGYSSAMPNERIGSQSEGWSLHAGVGSYMTDRITYRLSAGVTGFKYGNQYDTSGFTYNASIQWQLAARWNMNLLAACYYAPSERDYGTSSRNDTLSWGLAHDLVRGKLTATFDVSYRHMTCESYVATTSDYNADILTGRLGLRWSINRFVSWYGNVEYITESDEGNYQIGNAYDYDRWRLTTGVRLTY